MKPRTRVAQVLRNEWKVTIRSPFVRSPRVGISEKLAGYRALLKRNFQKGARANRTGPGGPPLYGHATAPLGVTSTPTVVKDEPSVTVTHWSGVIVPGQGLAETIAGEAARLRTVRMLFVKMAWSPVSLAAAE